MKNWNSLLRKNGAHAYCCWIEEERWRIKYKLEEMSKSVCMLNSRVNNLDVILSVVNLQRTWKDLAILVSRPSQRLTLFLLLLKLKPRCLVRMSLQPFTYYYQHSDPLPTNLIGCVIIVVNMVIFVLNVIKCMGEIFIKTNYVHNRVISITLVLNKYGVSNLSIKSNLHQVKL